METIKRCGCGASYTRAQWEALPFVGRQSVPDDEDGPGWTIEMANCSCGTTLALEVVDRMRWDDAAGWVLEGHDYVVEEVA